MFICKLLLHPFIAYRLDGTRQIACEMGTGKSYAIKIERLDRVVIGECSGAQVVVLPGD